MSQPTGPLSDTNPALNIELARRVQGADAGGVELSGSLYAAPHLHQPAVAELLAQQNAWVHADVFPNPRTGVSLDLIRDLADRHATPIDVHLLTADALEALPHVCRPGVARVTFPFEGVPDPVAVAARIRDAGATPWLAIAPGTTVEACADTLPHVDGLLVMLLEPGTTAEPDLALLAKVREACADKPVGVDGGVAEGNLDDVLSAGATYVVVGRRLFAPAVASKAQEVGGAEPDPQGGTL